MLLTPADIAFGLCVKERAQWICEKCSTEYPRGSRGLHCAHFQGRGAWATRFEPENCFAFCYGHHRFFDSRKGSFAQFFIERRGQEIYDMVMKKSENTDLAKIIRRTKGKGEIAAFFRECYANMLRIRAGGRIGWLPFSGWA
jgi:hypothetical protein